MIHSNVFVLYHSWYYVGTNHIYRTLTYTYNFSPRRAYNTFEERAEAAYGYKIDHDYWNKDNRREGKYKIAFACLIWTIFGTIIQFAAVHWTTRKQIIHMNQQDLALNKQHDEVQINAQKRGNLKNRDNGEYEKLLALYKSDRDTWFKENVRPWVFSLAM